jgi:hypothetical protein
MGDARARVIGSRDYSDFTAVSVEPRAKVGAKVLASRLSTLSMVSSFSKAGRRVLATTAAALALLAMAVGLSGCPVAAELENEDRFPALASGGATSTGGAAPTGGSAGSAGGANCEAPLPTVDCDWRAAIGTRSVPGFCAKSGCHNQAQVAGDLNLQTALDLQGTPDLLFASRLLNVPAARDILCGTAMCDPAAATCDKCMACSPVRPVLISTQNPGQGWIFDKIAPYMPGTTVATLPIGCGDAMPTYNTSGTSAYTADHKACLIKFFTALAMTPGTWPCGQSAGGSGGGGAGGGGAGAGAGGAGGGAGLMSGAGGT